MTQKNRVQFIEKQIGKYIQTIFLSDDYGNDYEVDVFEYYSLDGLRDDRASIFYFESENEYLIYVNETENES